MENKNTYCTHTCTRYAWRLTNSPTGVQCVYIIRIFMYVINLVFYSFKHGINSIVSQNTHATHLTPVLNRYAHMMLSFVVVAWRQLGSWYDVIWVCIHFHLTLWLLYDTG